MEYISYNYVKVRVDLPPLVPVLLLLTGKVPLLVGEAPLLVGEAPLLAGDVSLLVGFFFVLVRGACTAIVDVSFPVRGLPPLPGVLALVSDIPIVGNVPLLVEDVTFTRPQEKDKQKMKCQKQIISFHIDIKACRTEKSIIIYCS